MGTALFIQHLLNRLGNQQAIDNARMASTDLSRRRVEREDVELFLERLDVRRPRVTDGRPQVAASAAP